MRAEAARRVEEASAQHASALADAKERAAAAEGRAASSERRNEELEGRRRELDSKVRTRRRSGGGLSVLLTAPSAPQVESLSAELRDAREQASSQRATVHELQAALAQREDALADATARIRSAEVGARPGSDSWKLARGMGQVHCHRGLPWWTGHHMSSSPRAVRAS